MVDFPAPAEPMTRILRDDPSIIAISGLLRTLPSPSQSPRDREDVEMDVSRDEPTALPDVGQGGGASKETDQCEPVSLPGERRQGARHEAHKAYRRHAAVRDEECNAEIARSSTITQGDRGVLPSMQHC